MKPLLLTAALLLACSVALVRSVAGRAADDNGPFDPNLPKPHTGFVDVEHDDSFAYSALEQVSGERLPSGSTRGDFARSVLAELSTLTPYGEKQTANVRGAIPDWFLDGYRHFAPRSLAKSRYLDGVIAGRLPADADTAAVYAFYSTYDAEWFSLARNPGFKAWLSAVLLTYPPQWLKLEGESEASLHARLVAPLQTPGEPYREIDNWIGAFTRLEGPFAKPKVRSALVAELLDRGGMDADRRFFEKRAFTAPAPGALGLDDQKFFLLAALTLEYFEEIYALDPATKQPLYFRDYFLSAYNGLK